MLERDTKDHIPAGFTLRNTLPTLGEVIHRLAWSPDGDTLAIAYRNEAIQLWDVSTERVRQSFEGTINYSLAWSPDGKMLASGNRSSLFLWDTETGELRSIVPNKLTTSVVWSPSGQTLAFSSNNNISLWNPATEQLICKLTGHSNGINSIAWSPDGRTLASGSDDRTIRIWNPATEELIDTFVGHSNNVNSIAWSPDGQTLASASDDETICLWDVEERRLSAVIETHTKPIVCIAFYRDGRLLASKSLDGTVRLWQCDTREEVAKLDEPAYGWYGGLAFHPHVPYLATLGAKDTIVRIWDLNIDYILNNTKVASTVQYTSAKVVLLGDSGVGKTSLSLVLTDQPYVPPEATHGRRVLLFNSQESTIDTHSRAIREILLWDLAGQAHYRLIHRLYMNEVNLALIVFNPHNDKNPFTSVQYWINALKVAKNTSGTMPTSLLIATHMDLSEKSISRKRISDLKQNLQIECFETSAKKGSGIKELAGAIQRTIDWETLPTVNSFELFQNIKNFIAIQGERKRDELLSIPQLYQNFLFSQPELTNDTELFDQFNTCLAHMDSQGIIKKLEFGSFVLLKPELLDCYASALINAVLYDEVDGLGSILEGKVLAGDFDIPPGERLEDKSLEKILLPAVVAYLQRHEIVLQESSDEGSYLVFPSLVTHEISDFTPVGQKVVVFRFNGSVSHIYAKLAVRLSHNHLFKKEEIGKDVITFTCSFDKLGLDSNQPESEDDESRPKSRTYGLFLQSFAEGSGELTVFHENGREQSLALFIRFIYFHLQLHAINIQQEYIAETQKDLLQVDQTLISDMNLAADARRDNNVEISTRYGASQARINRGDFDVYFCYNSEDRALVQKIKQNLMKNEIAPFDEKEDLPPGLRRQSEKDRRIKNIKSAAVFVGQTGFGPWEKGEVETLLRELVQRNSPVIPVLLPNAPREPELPSYLKAMAWVDFRPPERSTYEPLDSLPLERLSPDHPLSDHFLSMEENHKKDQGDDQDLSLLEEQKQDPMDLLVLGITGERVKEKIMTNTIKKNRLISQEKSDRGEYDVFISHNHQDRARVLEISELLKDNGVAPFLDEWVMQPGLPWQAALEEQIRTVKSAAIFVGEAGMGSWHRKEMNAFEREFEKRNLPVIPVLLPDISSTRELPLFLEEMTWVDFREKNPDPLDQLIWGITGKRRSK